MNNSVFGRYWHAPSVSVLNFTNRGVVQFGEFQVTTNYSEGRTEWFFGLRVCLSESKRSASELVNVMAWDTECEPVCKLAKLSPLRRDSVSRSSCGCVTERNCLPMNMSHVLARVRDVLIEFTVSTNLPFRTAKSFQLLEIWTNPTIREAAFRSLGE